MSGHIAPLIGAVMEDEFSLLVEELGYEIKRKLNPKPAIDLVADFIGKPRPETPKKCVLLRPIFSPAGTSAFSIKRGDFREVDVTKLLDDIQKARNSRNTRDADLKSIAGGIIVTNHTKTEGEIDALFQKGIYCWDIRRLIFYTIKARIVQEFAKTGPILEEYLPQEFKGSYLKIPDRITEGSTFMVHIIVFIDDHHAFLVYDDIVNILKHIYVNSLEPIVRTTNCDVLATITVHVLGLANPELAEQAYVEYAGKQFEHPRVSFSATPLLRVFQYGAAPWTPIFHL